jgi:hypothetical protein
MLLPDVRMATGKERQKGRWLPETSSGRKEGREGEMPCSLRLPPPLGSLPRFLPLSLPDLPLLLTPSALLLAIFIQNGQQDAHMISIYPYNRPEEKVPLLLHLTGEKTEAKKINEIACDHRTHK